MKNLKIARRYAKALLLIGKEDGQTEAYRTELTGFATLLSDQPDLAGALNNPIYESASRRNLLLALLEKTDFSVTTRAFLTLLFDKGRLGYVEAITGMFDQLADELNGVARAKLVTASELGEETVEKIREGLSKMTGKVVKLQVEKDPALIGGVVTTIGDLVLDGSVRTQLNNLKETLKRSEAV